MTRFENSTSLIYIKPIPEFFSSEHTPLFCWKGSGYTFQSIAETTIDHTAVYRGVLTKGSAKLYTAWWYTNGTTRTISQAEWRWHMLRGEHRFYLINVTVSDPDRLSQEVALVLAGEESLK